MRKPKPEEKTGVQADLTIQIRPGAGETCGGWLRRGLGVLEGGGVAWEAESKGSAPGTKRVKIMFLAERTIHFTAAQHPGPEVSNGPDGGRMLMDLGHDVRGVMGDE